AQLTTGRGGPLGVDSVKEILVGTTDLERATGLSQRLLEPTPSSEPGAWPFTSGPGIRLIRARENPIPGMVIRANPLTKAKDYLRENDVLATDSAGEAMIDLSKIGGLNIRLVEQK